MNWMSVTAPSVGQFLFADVAPKPATVESNYWLVQIIREDQLPGHLQSAATDPNLYPCWLLNEPGGEISTPL